MSFAAEPYEIFVDDLVSGLTGGIVRERFEFLPELAPFRLDAGADVVATTVRVHGIAGGAFAHFAPGTDFLVIGDGTIAWQATGTTPDAGTDFYAAYERRPDLQAPPLLTDRNPGSVVRTLAESFAREYAVLSRQVELVHQAGFLATAAGRDLDNLAALVGVERRNALDAVGEVELSRRTPAPADVTIPEGTLVSSADAPAAAVETTENRVLRRGALSVTVPVRALVSGAAGVARAGSLRLINRPILGIDAVTNPRPLSFDGGTDTDDVLRRRVARALQVAGRSTTAAIVGALITVEGIREQDVAVVEDHNGAPGVVKVTVAVDLPDDVARRAAALIDEVRPAGVRVLHNLPLPLVPAQPSSPGGGADDPSVPPATGGLVRDAFLLVGARVVVTAASTSLTTAQRAELTDAVRAAATAFVDGLGVGDAVVYNALVAALMKVDGVYDVSLDLYPFNGDDPPAVTRTNLLAVRELRPHLEELDVTLRGAEVALDVAVAVELRGEALADNDAAAVARVTDEVRAALAEHLRDLPEGEEITPAALELVLQGHDDFIVDSLNYTIELVEEGLRVLQSDAPFTPSPAQVVRLRVINVRQGST